jgi:hypothetical protein
MARQVLPIVGAIVGAYFGNPQLGYAIGSIIGNAVDPLQIDGPRIGDAARQTTTEGSPRPIPYGKVMYAANVLEIGELRKVYRNESQGKGGGPEVKKEYLYQTFVYGFGEAPPGGVTGFSLIKMDGAVVYDTRPDSTILEASAKFAQKFRFYNGSNDQVEDPALEAIHGTDATCVYRGTPYFVFEDWDITGRAGTTPVLEVEFVAGTGTVAEESGGWMVGPVAINGALGGSQQYYQRAATLEELPSAPKTLAPHTFSTISRASNGTLFMYSNSNMSVSTDRGMTWTLCTGIGFGTISDWREVYWNGHYYYHHLYRSANGVAWEAIPNLPVGTTTCVAREFFNNPLVAVTNAGGGSAGIHISYDDSATWELKRSPGTAVSDMTPGHLTWRWTENSTLGRYSDDDFDTTLGEISAPYVDYRPYYSDDFHGSWMRKTFDKGIIWWSGNPGDVFELTLDVALGSNNENSVAWGDNTWVALRKAGSASYININRENGAPDDVILGPRWTELATPLYGNLGNIVYTGPVQRGITSADQVTLASIIGDICRRCGMEAEEYDVTDLETTMVTGLVLAGAYTGKDAIRAIAPGYFFDAANMDGKLTFVRRGKASKGTITLDDLLDKPVRSKRGYPREYPKKLHMGYMSAVTNYTPAKATSARESASALVKGEKQFQVPMVLTSDEAHRIVDINHKVMFTEAEGEVELVVGEEWLEATPTDCYDFDDGVTVDRLRIEETEYADGEIKWKCKYDRITNYSSTASSPSEQGPTSPPSTNPGATRFVLMNIPAVEETDDGLGYRVGVVATAASWSGVQVQRTPVTTNSFQVGADIVEQSVAGVLVAPIAAAPRFVTDTVNSVRVLMYYGAPEGRTDQEWKRNGGAIAIVSRDGTAEIVQFRDVVDHGDGSYTLSPLMRGRRNTEARAHTPGEMVVFLYSSFFLTAPVSYLGVDMKHRPVSYGSTVEETQVYEHTFETLYAQEEFPVAGLAATRSTSNVITATWRGRGRFGKALAPVHSQHFMGFQVTFVKGATTVTMPIQIAPTIVYDATALGSGVTVRVQQVNRYTGNGPAKEIVV